MSFGKRFLKIGNKCSIVIIICLFQLQVVSQTKDSSNKVINIKSSASITNNGFSFIPTFSLGKPAVILNAGIGGKKISFEPEFRFSLQAKPWSFLYWVKYKIVNTKKIKLNTGANLGLAFKSISAIINNNVQTIQQVLRYSAGELSSNYFISNNKSIGIYYLYSHGLDEGTIKNTHFITLNSSISNIKLLPKIFFKFVPQVYYLNMDNKDGIYFTSTSSISKKDFPYSISSTLNKKIKSNISGKNFDWNISLMWAYNKNYTKLKKY
jgi:hypothetical protein